MLCENSIVCWCTTFCLFDRFLWCLLGVVFWFCGWGAVIWLCTRRFRFGFVLVDVALQEFCWHCGGGFLVEAIIVFCLLFSLRFCSFGTFYFFDLSCFLLVQLIFCWRVWSWLRMNAGGVLNTCKSNGKAPACWGARVANGWVTRKWSALHWGISLGNWV